MTISSAHSVRLVDTGPGVHLDTCRRPPSQRGKVAANALLPRSAIESALARVRGDVNATILAVSGGYDMAMVAAAGRLGYRVITARSEAGAAFAAAALAWETERPALVVVITSPGVYGTLQALHYAFVSRVPLIVLSGESSLPGSVQAGDGVGGPSVTRLSSALTAWSADIMRPDELPRALVRAVWIASTQARPVHLNVPSHVAASEISP